MVFLYRKRSLSSPLRWCLLVYILNTIHCQAIRHKKPARLYILAGDDNVEGFASLDHLHQLAFQDDNNGAPQYQHLVNGTAWKVRDDVTVIYDQHLDQEFIYGPLSADGGFAGDKSSFGPELQIGEFLGNLYSEHIILLKVWWKTRSLKEFRSPSSGKIGFQWDRMISDIHKVMSKPEKYIGKDFRNTRPVLAGFVWWHGYNDVYDAQKASAYPDLLEKFIRDVRLELRHPELPIVVAELGGKGSHPDKQEKEFREMQKQVVEQRFYPYNTKFVPTSPYIRSDPPTPKDYELYYGRADVMLEISQALAVALITSDFSKHDMGGLLWQKQMDRISFNVSSWEKIGWWKWIIIGGTAMLLGIMVKSGEQWSVEGFSRAYFTLSSRCFSYLLNDDDNLGAVVSDAELGLDDEDESDDENEIEDESEEEDQWLENVMRELGFHHRK
jgi:alpha-galactosidase